LRFIQGFEKLISDNLILKIARVDNEIEREQIAEINEKIHGAGLGDYIRRIFDQHPRKDEILFFYIEHLTDDRIVSTAAMLPLEWNNQNVKFKVAEMGFVGTLEEYRGQGLYSIINEYFELAAQERGMYVSALVGIPYFYRIFGYDFALTSLSWYQLSTDNIPIEETVGVTIREAKEEDIRIIQKLYIQSNKQFEFCTSLHLESAKFRLICNKISTFNSITYIVEEDHIPVGFFSLTKSSDESSTDINLIYNLTKNQMMKVLEFVRIKNGKEIQELKINIDSSTELAKYLESLNANLTFKWPWQIKILNFFEFINLMKPVLEERINSSIFAGLNTNFSISNYREIITMTFHNGKIIDIEQEKNYPTSQCNLRISPFIISSLLFAYRSVSEIKYIITDTLYKKTDLALIDVLFPKKPSQPYSYYQ
jgi:predicted acetyltransferase